MSARNNRNNPTHPRRLKAQERRDKAWELRKAGATLRQIADALELSPSGVSKMLKQQMEDARQDLADRAADYIEVELARLEGLITVAASKLKDDTALEAVKTMLAIIKSERELLGLDAARKLDVTSGGAPIEILVRYDRNESAAE